MIDFVIEGYGLWHEYLKVGDAKEDEPAPIDEIQSAFTLLENLFYCDLWIRHTLGGNPEAHLVIRRLQNQLRKEYPQLSSVPLPKIDNSKKLPKVSIILKCFVLIATEFAKTMQKYDFS